MPFSQGPPAHRWRFPLFGGQCPYGARHILQPPCFVPSAHRDLPQMAMRCFCSPRPEEAGKLRDVFPPKSEMISKSSDVSEIFSDIFQKISHVFGKNSDVFWKNSDVFFERSAENSLRSLVSRKFSASSSVKHGGLLVCFLGNR